MSDDKDILDISKIDKSKYKRVTEDEEFNAVASVMIGESDDGKIWVVCDEGEEANTIVLLERAKQFILRVIEGQKG